MNSLLKNIEYFAHNTPNNIALQGTSARSAENSIEAGCHLILVGREQAKLDQLIDDLRQSSNYLSIAADIGCAQGIQSIDKGCQLYIQEGIPIDIVINNAGCNTFDYLARRTLTSIEQEIAVNISAPIQLTKLSLTWLSYPGIILNIGSTYCATKAALHRFSEAMQRELKDTGRQVLFVAPRATYTDLNDRRAAALNKK